MCLKAALQNFAWTEEHRARVRAERAAQCGSEAQRQAMLKEPVFCFETAYKALYWSILVYRIQARQAWTCWLHELHTSVCAAQTCSS